MIEKGVPDPVDNTCRLVAALLMTIPVELVVMVIPVVPTEEYP